MVRAQVETVLQSVPRVAALRLGRPLQEVVLLAPVLAAHAQASALPALLEAALLAAHHLAVAVLHHVLRLAALAVLDHKAVHHLAEVVVVDVARLKATTSMYLALSTRR